MVELNKRELEEADGNIKFCDDYIKSQGLVGKYVIPTRAYYSGMGMGNGDITVSEERDNADIIDSIVDEEENNGFLGGEGEMRSWIIARCD